MTLLCVNTAHSTRNSEFSLPSRQSRKFMRIRVIVKKILPVAFIGDRNRHFTCCCLGHSDLNSHFKNLNTSNTSLTLCEPYKPKHTFSTLPFKQNSMCHRQICIRQKIITENPEFTWQGIPRFQRISSDHCGFFELFDLYQ